MPQITLEWGGAEYVIPEEQAFEVGEKVEDIISLSDIPKLAEKPNFHRLARVYALMLTHAGAKGATPAAVHSAMMAQVKAVSDDATASDARQMVAAQALAALVDILMDGAPEAAKGGSGKK